MKLAILEPYFTGSHRAWAEGYASHSNHDIKLVTMNGRFWKWRMHGGAITIARLFRENGITPDIIIASSMLDLTTFQALTRDITSTIPTVMYFHENQFAYPWQKSDRDRKQGRDIHYGFINFVSALSADRVFFNSEYNRRSFFEGLKKMLKHFPDFNELNAIDQIAKKSSVLHLGLDLIPFSHTKGEHHTNTTPRSELQEIPVIVWNHRWEYDKNPETFFKALFMLADRGLDFRVIVAGENFRQRPTEFMEAERRLGPRLIHFGYADDRMEYARLLGTGNLLPVTSLHDFFGASVCEAICSGCFPLLPRRVSYPELIPQELHDIIFYDSDEEFFRRLKEEMTNWNMEKWKQRRLKAMNKLQEHIKGFSWELMAPEYDRVFADAARPTT